MQESVEKMKKVAKEAKAEVLSKEGGHNGIIMVGLDVNCATRLGTLLGNAILQHLQPCQHQISLALY